MPDTTQDTTPKSDAFSTARPDLGAAVSEIKTALAGKAEELAGRSAESGAAAVAALGKTAATLATSLEDQSPAVANYVRSTGQRIDRLADDLRDKSVGELLTIATDFGKRQPLALLAGSAIVGFALARMVKAGMGASTGAPGPRADIPNVGRIDV
jgi:hypothetical protein